MKKKSAPALGNRNAKEGCAYSVASFLRDVKRLLCGVCALLATLFAMLFYGALAERLASWYFALPACMVFTLAAAALFRAAERGEDGTHIDS